MAGINFASKMYIKNILNKYESDRECKNAGIHECKNAEFLNLINVYIRLVTYHGFHSKNLVRAYYSLVFQICFIASLGQMGLGYKKRLWVLKFNSKPIYS